jgi:3-hydroxybutyryl-CoA dehydrogenase
VAIERVLILGAGTMGTGIAQAAALAGYHTTVRDVDDAMLAKAKSALQSNLAKGVEKGKVAKADATAAEGRLKFVKDLWEAAHRADLVIEAVPEKLELKQRVFKDLDDIVPATAILATNTSALSVAAIAEATRQPARVVGMHFFNPAHILPLVEIVRHEANADATVEAAVAAATKMGKQPIVVKDSPGFASSRLGLVLGLEAIRMLEQGVASAEDIDKAMELGYSHPMGPLKLTDLVGLDVRLAIAEHLSKTLGDRFEPPQLLRDMVKQGKLGRKSGRGFYEYPR